MDKVLNLLGIIGAISVLLGFAMLDSTGKWGTIAIVLSMAGLTLVILWVETIGRRFA